MTVRYSDLAFLDILDALPTPDIGWSIEVISAADYNSIIDVVPYWKDLKFLRQLSAVGNATLEVPKTARFLTQLVSGGGTVVDRPCMLRIKDEGVPRFEFLIEAGHRPDVSEDDSTFVLAGPGTGKVLADGVVLPEGWPTTSAKTRTFTAPRMQVWRTLFLEAQARGCFPMVALTFDDTMDTALETWTDNETFDVNAGDNILDLLDQWCALVGATWVMRPGFKLCVYRNFGNDRTDAIVFNAGGHLIDHVTDMSYEDIATAVYASSGSVIAETVDSAAASLYRRRESWIDAGDAGTTAAASQYASKNLEIKSTPSLQRTFRIPFKSPNRRTFVDWDFGDTIGIDISGSPVDTRVIAITTHIDENGQTFIEVIIDKEQAPRMASSIRSKAVLSRQGSKKVDTKATKQSTAGKAAASDATILVGLTELDTLSNVTAPTPTPADLLYWNGTAWVNRAVSLGDLADVNAPTPADGQIIKWDAATSKWITGTGGGGGGGPVAPEIKLPLTTLTGWTVGSGTWSIGGSGYITITGSGSAFQRVLRLDSMVGTSMVVVEVEARVVSGSGATQRLSVGIDEPTNGTTKWPVVHLQTGDNGTTWRAAADAKDVTSRGSGSTIAGATGYNVWRKMRCVFVGDAVSVYVDDVLAGTFTNLNNTDGSLENRYITLGGYNVNGDFRNLNVWSAGQIASQLATGSGTSAGSIADRAWVKGSTSHAQDDEFNDGVLSGSWVRVDNTGAASRVTWTEKGDVLSMLHTGGDAASEHHALMKPYVMAVGESLETATRVVGFLASYKMSTLLVADGVTYGAGTQQGVRLYYHTGGINITSEPLTGYNNEPSLGQVDLGIHGSIGIVYQRLTRVSSTQWQPYFSIDGVSWIPIGTPVTRLSSPTHIGVAVSTWSGATGFAASWEYVRVV